MSQRVEEELDRSRVLELTIPIQSLTEAQTKRITSLDCLNESFVREQISPNQIAEVRADGVNWSLIVPHGGYTPAEHLMAMRSKEGYVAGPEGLPAGEGDDLFYVMGHLAQRMINNPDVSTVVFGWNWSPRSFGQKGYQSIPTKFHPSIFCLPRNSEASRDYMRFVDLNSLRREEVRAIKGSKYNLLFGNLLARHVLNGRFKGDKEIRDKYLNIGEACIKEQGTAVPIKGSLDEVLMAAGIFSGVFQPMSRFIDQLSAITSSVLTDLNPVVFDQVVEKALANGTTEEQRNAAMAYLTRTPNLLPKQKREYHIRQLQEARYPDDIVEAIRRTSNKLPDNQVPLTGWKVGFGCAVAIVYDTSLQEGVLSISAAVSNGPGGIVESGVKAILRRPPQPFSREEMATKTVRYLELVDNLPKTRILGIDKY